MLATFLNFLSDSVFNLFDALFSVLAPASATNYTGQIYLLMDDEIVEKALSWVNYFLPISQAAAVIATWAAVMIGYLAYRVVMDTTRTVI